MKAVALWMLRGYKRWISPALPPSCRYVPTCSEYAMEAVERYGTLRGLAMTTGRLLRCHPFAKGGLDPVVKHGGRACRGPFDFAQGRLFDCVTVSRCEAVTSLRMSTHKDN